MAQSYKIETYRRHVYRLRPKPTLAIAAELEPVPELDPAAAPEDAELAGAARFEDAALDGHAQHEATPELAPAALADHGPALANVALPGEDPQLAAAASEPVAPALHDLAPLLAHPDLAPPLDLTWVELTLLDEDGQPMGGQPYAVTGSDGTVKFGRTRDDGTARVDDLSRQDCSITFPKLDRTAWELVDEVALPERTWIEIVLLDEQGRPMGTQPYEVREPSGRTRRGSLDADGKARVLGVEPGTCEVTFPGLDVTLWEPFVRLPPPPERTWLEIVLTDDAGKPMAAQRYQVREKSGRFRRGVLDDQGKARVEGLEHGSCEVSFPDLDTAAWESLES